MKNKGAIIFLSVAITALCLFSLSFTYMANKVDNEIAAHGDAKVEEARAAGKNVDLDSLRKSEIRSYRDSLWKKEVYLGYTYKEVKAKSLNLGLDLQGGIHATLIVSPVEILKSMSDDSQDPDFLAALDFAKKEQANSQDKFTAIFLKAFQERKGANKLAAIFVNVDNKFNITPSSTDEDIIKIVDKQLDESIDNNLTILRARVDKYGTTSPSIQAVKATGRIEVELPGADDEDGIARQLVQEAKLEFREVLEQNEWGAIFQEINAHLATTDWVKDEIEAILSQNNDELATGGELPVEEDDALFGDGEAEVEGDSAATEEIAEGTEEAPVEELDSAALAAASQDSLQQAQSDYLRNNPLLAFTTIDPNTGNLYASTTHYKLLNDVFSSKGVQDLLPEDVKIVWEDKVNTKREFVQVYFVRIPLNEDLDVSGDLITDSRPSFDQRGRPSVNMVFNSEGRLRFKKVTGVIAQKTAERRRLSQNPEFPAYRLAIVLDNIVYSAPGVANEIDGGNAEISGSFEVRETQDLARILKSGRLDAPMEVERMVIVGPSLGQAAIDRGLLSLIAGLALVVAFMVFYYSKGGLVADVALLFNIFFILGLLAQKGLNAALTLPGIAGIVLTIGMSIDANVLVFERIREEIAAGKPLKIAINNGYQRAFWSIFDSNITTLITALILFYFGSGLIKGFAITLAIGIVSSFFSAVFITRLIIESMTKGKDDASVSFSTSLSKGMLKGKNFNFIGKRKVAYAISLIVIVVGMGLVAVQGLNLGVAFSGGHSYIVQFGQDVNPTEVKSELAAVFKDASTEVKSFDGGDQVQITTSFMMKSDDEKADEIVKNTLIQGLAKYKDLNPEIVQSVVVGPTIADDIKKTSVKSIIIALVAIFIYIIGRFRKVGFGIGAFVALLHDVLFVISIFAIARVAGVAFEIDEVFVAAILTLVGYSINDTVVVFDHVREHLAGRKGLSKDAMGDVLNKALNGTLSRTMMTSLTTLLVIIILFIFGGEALRGFSFALLVGVLVGTYSSVFVATPVVLDTTSNNEKESKE